MRFSIEGAFTEACVASNSVDAMCVPLLCDVGIRSSRHGTQCTQRRPRRSSRTEPNRARWDSTVRRRRRRHIQKTFCQIRCQLRKEQEGRVQQDRTAAQDCLESFFSCVSGPHGCPIKDSLHTHFHMSLCTAGRISGL